LATEILEKCSKLISAYQPNYDRLVADVAGRYAAFYRTASACHPRAGAVVTILTSEQ